MKKNKGRCFTIGCLLIGQIVFLPACSVRKQREKSVWRQEETYRLQTDSLFSGGKRRRESKSIRQWEMIRLSPPDSTGRQHVSAGGRGRAHPGSHPPGTPGAAVPSRRTACGETSPEPSGKRRTTVRETRQKNSRPRPPYGNGWPGSLPSSGESRDSAGSAGISVRRQGRISVLRGRSCRPGG